MTGVLYIAVACTLASWEECVLQFCVSLPVLCRSVCVIDKCLNICEQCASLSVCDLWGVCFSYCIFSSNVHVVVKSFARSVHVMLLFLCEECVTMRGVCLSQVCVLVRSVYLEVLYLWGVCCNQSIFSSSVHLGIMCHLRGVCVLNYWILLQMWGVCIASWLNLACCCGERVIDKCFARSVYLFHLFLW